MSIYVDNISKFPSQTKNPLFDPQTPDKEIHQPSSLHNPQQKEAMQMRLIARAWEPRGAFNRIPPARQLYFLNRFAAKWSLRILWVTRTRVINGFCYHAWNFKILDRDLRLHTIGRRRNLGLSASQPNSCPTAGTPCQSWCQAELIISLRNYIFDLVEIRMKLRVSVKNAFTNVPSHGLQSVISLVHA